MIHIENLSFRSGVNLRDEPLMANLCKGIIYILFLQKIAIKTSFLV